MDKVYYSLMHVNVHQVGEEKWLYQNFHKWDEKAPKPQWNRLVKFHRVWELTIHQDVEGTFVKCGCTHFEEVGYPCSCFLLWLMPYIPSLSVQVIVVHISLSLGKMRS